MSSDRLITPSRVPSTSTPLPAASFRRSDQRHETRARKTSLIQGLTIFKEMLQFW